MVLGDWHWDMLGVQHPSHHRALLPLPSLRRTDKPASGGSAAGSLTEGSPCPLPRGGLVFRGAGRVLRGRAGCPRRAGDPDEGDPAQAVSSPTGLSVAAEPGSGDKVHGQPQTQRAMSRVQGVQAGAKQGQRRTKVWDRSPRRRQGRGRGWKRDPHLRGVPPGTSCWRHRAEVPAETGWGRAQLRRELGCWAEPKWAPGV